MKLRNAATGAVVDVSEETAAALGAEFQPVKAEGEAQTTKKPALARKPAAKK